MIINSAVPSVLWTLILAVSVGHPTFEAPKQGVNVSVMITDQYGDPIPGGKGTLTNRHTRQVFTFSGGKTVLSNVPFGQYTLQAEAFKFCYSDKIADVFVDDTFLVAAIQCPLEGVVQEDLYKGHVVNGTGKVDLLEISFHGQFIDHHARAAVKANGEFQIRLPLGKFVVVVHREGQLIYAADYLATGGKEPKAITIDLAAKNASERK